jgi:hypothetical protein
MLKIDVADQVGEQGITVRLEGRMVGPWVQELQRACEPYLGNGHVLTLDFGGVSFIGREGVALCRVLERRHARFTNCSPFIKEQLNA